MELDLTTGDVQILLKPCSKYQVRDPTSKNQYQH